MEDSIPFAGPEGTQCPSCGYLIRRWPEPHTVLVQVREALVTLSKLVDELNTEDEAAFAYAFGLSGQRQDGTYWPESTDDVYYGIEARARQVRDAMDKLISSAIWVQSAIAVDNTGERHAKTLRFPLGAEEEEAVKALHPRRES